MTGFGKKRRDEAIIWGSLTLSQVRCCCGRRPEHLPLAAVPAHQGEWAHAAIAADSVTHPALGVLSRLALPA